MNKRRNRNLGVMKSSTEALGSFTPVPKLRLEYTCNTSQLLHCVLLLSGSNDFKSGQFVDNLICQQVLTQGKKLPDQISLVH